MSQQLLVEGESESTINVESMEHSHTQHTTNKVEIRQMLLCNYCRVIVCVRKRERSIIAFKSLVRRARKVNMPSRQELCKLFVG